MFCVFLSIRDEAATRADSNVAEILNDVVLGFRGRTEQGSEAVHRFRRSR